MQICVVHPKAYVLVTYFARRFKSYGEEGCWVWVLRFMVCSVGSW